MHIGKNLSNFSKGKTSEHEGLASFLVSWDNFLYWIEGWKK